MSIFGTILFGVELYHTVGHGVIMFRQRMLPAKDISRLRFYFFIDLMTVATSYMYTRQLFWLAALQNIQHLFYFLTWNKGFSAIKVMQWSSLDWLQTDNNKIYHWDQILGTGFDMGVHITYAYLIAQHLPTMNIALGFAVTALGSVAILFNKRLAWCKPSDQPEWVRKRVDSNSVPCYVEDKQK